MKRIGIIGWTGIKERKQCRGVMEVAKLIQIIYIYHRDDIISQRAQRAQNYYY